MANSRADCIGSSPFATASAITWRDSQRKLFSPLHSASCLCSGVRIVPSTRPRSRVSVQSWVYWSEVSAVGGGGKYDGVSAMSNVYGGTKTHLWATGGGGAARPED